MHSQSNTDSLKIDVLSHDLVDYQAGLEMQQDFHARRVQGKISDVIICLQHPNVLTFGKNSREDFFTADQSQLEKLNCQIVRTDRGGEITAHMPGQLVVYPIVGLKPRRLMPRSYICKLEQTVIDVLKELGIAAGRDKINPGVWVGDKKICAIGVRIREHVTMHGLALNVCNSFDLYDLIVPCGIAGRGVTSIERELNTKVSIARVSEMLCRILGEHLWVS